MAEKIQEKSQLRMTFHNGDKEDGTMILKSKLYSNIAIASSPDALLTVSEAIASLQLLPLVEVAEVVTYTLVNE
ncbi:DUF1659 domain-containing protein [Priestia flexa]|uniref:DUF1659 domain-containing protein n=1 Tax=Priestia flexa TaxID=86664 RepID=UPI001B343917|nr:DUF1659 domain-containing protein [Priestia flexa]